MGDQYSASCLPNGPYQTLKSIFKHILRNVYKILLD